MKSKQALRAAKPPSGGMGVLQQCPYSGGPAVYVMREEIEDLSDTAIDFNDDMVCLQQGIFREQQHSTSVNAPNKFVIIPNPATKEIEIRIDSHTASTCKIILQNTLSENVAQWNVNCEVKSHHININHISPGLYFVYFITSDGFTIKQKLVVMK